MNTPFRNYLVPEIPETLFLDLLVSLKQIDADVESIVVSSGSGLTDPGSNGILVRTATNTVTPRQLVQPAAGLTISNNDGVGGNPTFALTNDLASLEALTGSGLAKRTGTGDAWVLTTVTSELGFTPENVANKATDFSTINNTLYPTVQATKTYADSVVTGYVQATRTISAGVGLTGGGDLSANRTISMGTPSSLSVSTTNDATGTTHTHAISASSNPGAASALLKSDASGNLELVRLSLGDPDATFARIVVDLTGPAPEEYGIGLFNDLTSTSYGIFAAEKTYLGLQPHENPQGGNYYDSVRITSRFSGNPNDYDKWNGLYIFNQFNSLSASTNSTQDMYGVQVHNGILDAAGGAWNFWTVYGSYFVAFHNSPGQISDGLIGVMAKSDAYGSGAINKHRGLQGWASTQSGCTSNITASRGVYGLISHAGSGTMSAPSAGYFILDSNSGVMTTGVGVRIGNNAIGGSGTAKYGLYIEQQTVATPANWSSVLNIYSAGDVGNVFDGYVRAKEFRAGSTPTTLTDSAGKILSTALNTVGVAQGGTGVTVAACARVYNSTNISIPDNAVTALTFNSERFDTDAIHDTGSNTGRLTCKTAGKYIIIFHALFDAHATGWRMFDIRLNGTTMIGDSRFNATTTAGIGTGSTTSTIYELAVNDYVEAVVYQNSGGALNILAVGNQSPEFMMARLM